MDRELYLALTEDDIDVLKLRDWLQVRDQVTPTNNSVLHVACQHGSNKCVQEILERADEPLLLQTTSRGETALHLAARQGHHHAVEALLSKAKSSDHLSDDDLENPTTRLQKLIRAPNVELETALHAAVRYNHEKIVGVLVKEDPGYSYPRNKSDETPLYLAAARGYAGVTKVILDNCESPTFGGPHGRTALHGALMSSRGYECMRFLARSNPDLIKKLDHNGWTAFHFAAENDLLNSIEFLLNANRRVAYIADKKDKKTPLHIAAYKGYTRVIMKLLNYLPDIVDSVDGNGQNMFHIALKQDQSLLLKFILSETWKFDTLNALIIQKDMEGNTPLHLIAKLGYYIPRLPQWIPKTDQEVVDNTNLTPAEALYQYYSPLLVIGEMQNIDRSDVKSHDVRTEMRRQRANTHMVVAALVTTVALTAGFAMPGGFNGNLGPEQGSPLLLRKPAFNIFVVADTVALLFSISSLFLYFTLSFKLKRKAFITSFSFAVVLNIASIAAMMVAFIAGTYAVLSHSLVLAIAVSTLSSLFLLLVFSLSYRTSINMLRFPIHETRWWLCRMYYYIVWRSRRWDIVRRLCERSIDHPAKSDGSDLV
ncbi:hypothetical protein DCAR_0104745 [Daucus carota subsp. sativus]|uniref:PGG domain-containing protein n=1 Tax=Daucus carota subsp. sativus TaxID=79200 RepID=A0AAF0WAL5_DAUCS|nr:hypothetical protein DCAR_0104745 [Daucus carota subsp. sativus]